VVIPSGILEQVVDSAAEIEREDKAILAVIRKEDPLKVRWEGSPER
jgi:hypothetical protein